MSDEKKGPLGKKGILAVIAVVVVFVFYAIFSGEPEEVKVESAAAPAHYGTWLDTSKPVQPFSLESTSGGSFSEQNLKGQWSWVFFGFTNCPNMCPMAMKAMKTAVEKLRADGVTVLPQVILVSLDPVRDTLPDLKQYVTGYDPTFIGLVGSLDQVSVLADQMGASFKQLSDGSIQHSGTITVVDPQGAIRAYFTMSDDPAKMATDYEDMLKAAAPTV